MSDNGAKPRKLWHWAAVIALVMTFINAPVESARFAGLSLRSVGAFGGGLLRGDYSETDESDTTADPEPDPAPSPDDGEPVDANLFRADPESTLVDIADETPADEPDETRVVFRVDENGIRHVLDTATSAVVALHAEVQQAQDAGGFTVAVGGDDEEADE